MAARAGAAQVIVRIAPPRPVERIVIRPEPQACLGGRLLSLVRTRLRVGSGQLGTAAASGRGLGCPALGLCCSSRGVCVRRRLLALDAPEPSVATQTR